MKKFGMAQLKWSLRHPEKESIGFWRNLKGLFLNPHLEAHEWKVFSSTKRFLSVLWFIAFVHHDYRPTR
jgi:hypothetical protein